MELEGVRPGVREDSPPDVHPPRPGEELPRPGEEEPEVHGARWVVVHSHQDVCNVVSSRFRGWGVLLVGCAASEPVR